MKVDILGRELKVEDCVSVDSRVYRITRFTAKMVALLPLKSSHTKTWGRKETMKYASDLTLLPEEAVTFWLLKQ